MQLFDTLMVQGRSAGGADAAYTCATTFMSICWRQPTPTFAEEVPSQRGMTKFNPSFYVESQGAFAIASPTEMSVPAWCCLPGQRCLQQADFAEPMVRINTDRIDGADFGWSEASAWDAEAEFYARSQSNRER